MASAVTINGAVVGANGIDTGSLGATKMYAVYLIGDSTSYQDPAAILSLSASSPQLPQGYDIYRRIGWAVTNSSSQFPVFYQHGKDSNRVYLYDVGIAELSGGSSATFANIDCSSSVPVIATEALCDLLYTPDGATDVAEFRPGGSSASNGMVRIGTGVVAAQRVQAWLPIEVESSLPVVEYKVTSGDTLTVNVIGYKDYLG